MLLSHGFISLLLANLIKIRPLPHAFALLALLQKEEDEKSRASSSCGGEMRNAALLSCGTGCVKSGGRQEANKVTQNGKIEM